MGFLDRGYETISYSHLNLDCAQGGRSISANEIVGDSVLTSKPFAELQDSRGGAEEMF